jgi:caffeoyl-CoA O-methyltransferase
MPSPEEKGFGQGSVDLARWAEGVFRPEDDILHEIRERSVAAGLPPIQVGRFDGLHLEVLARAFGAKHAVEVGTLGGYSGVCLLRGMGPGGLLETFELEEKNAVVAFESFTKAGFRGRFRIHLGKAREELPRIESEGPFDLVFIDADKVSYPAYLDWAAENLRVGGCVLADNAFGWGGVAKTDAEITKEPVEQRPAEIASIQGLREFSRKLALPLEDGGRFRATMIPTEEGLAFGVKVR